jgi:hypothetical protein
METTALVPRTAPTRRVVYLALALLIVASIVIEVVRHRTGYWQLGVFGVGPDLALLAAAGAGLARGQIHPRAVPLYNALHRFWAPVVLLALAGLGVAGVAYLIGALVWCFHISFDRTVGYGLRTRDGLQRT